MKKRNGAFTLVELAVVIVILGILVAIAVPRFIDVEATAQSSAVQASEAAVRSGLALQYAELQGFPQAGSLATAVASRGTAITLSGGNMQVAINGTTYNIPVYTDSDCSTAVTASTDTVKCVGPYTS